MYSVFGVPTFLTVIIIINIFLFIFATHSSFVSYRNWQLIKSIFSLSFSLSIAGCVCGQKEYDKRRKRKEEEKKEITFCFVLGIHRFFFFEVLFEVFQVIICKMINENKKKLKENERNQKTWGARGKKCAKLLINEKILFNLTIFPLFAPPLCAFVRVAHCTSHTHLTPTPKHTHTHTYKWHTAIATKYVSKMFVCSLKKFFEARAFQIFLFLLPIEKREKNV